MNTAKIEALKAAAETAKAAHDAEKDRLTEAGYKSKERYIMLKDLKAVADAAHAEYYKYTKGQINQALMKIIKAGEPQRQAEARSRSAWKMAKFNAANKI